jgi:hypothetical protein
MGDAPPNVTLPYSVLSQAEGLARQTTNGFPDGAACDEIATTCFARQVYRWHDLLIGYILPFEEPSYVALAVQNTHHNEPPWMHQVIDPKFAEIPDGPRTEPGQASVAGRPGRPGLGHRASASSESMTAMWKRRAMWGSP